MNLKEKEILIPYSKFERGNLLESFSQKILEKLDRIEIPVRMAITRTDQDGYHCELGVLSNADEKINLPANSIFDFNKRNYENVDEFNAVLLVPTGIGAEVGGHSGDAGPLARLFASSCDNLITHPNVVNASDINELPENGLYVEGSVISRLFMGTVGLQKVRSNRVMLILDKHQDDFFHEAAINAVSAARAALGLEVPLVVKMDDKITMHSLYSNSGRAVGRIDYFERICEILEEHKDKYDAVALSSVIKVPKSFHVDYYLEDMVNPWGGVEAMLTHTISLLFNVPSAHSPMLETREILELNLGIVDPRKAAEIVSVTFLHSILKGLHKSPRIITNTHQQNDSSLITANDVSCLIIPDGCVGLPTLAAIEQGIPVIAVRENRNRMENNLEDLPFAPGKLFIVENYWEAVGVMNSIRAGVSPAAVRRPFKETMVSEYRVGDAGYMFEGKTENLAPEECVRRKKKEGTEK